MQQLLIKEARLVNEGGIFSSDLLIKGDRIEKIASNIRPTGKVTVIQANHAFLIPGMIDAHVHFREPGLIYKGTMATESAAAVAGGVTSVFEMPNTLPNTTTLELLEQKYELARNRCYTNFSFFMGVNHTNMEEGLRVNNETVCGITDDGLLFEDGKGGLCDRETYLEELFRKSDSLIALHCEDEATIRRNTAAFYDKYLAAIPYASHAEIRSEEACLLGTTRAVDLARKTGARLHVLHVSTASEAGYIAQAARETLHRISGEVCVHHLYFSDLDYARYGAHIVWNPSIKTESNRKALLAALTNNELDFVATDHAPHSIAEKQGSYLALKPGAPSVQHALRALLHLFHNAEQHLPFIVSKTSHTVAERYGVRERGYLREGYYADLVLLNLEKSLRPEERLYQCGWSPFYNQPYGSSIEKTFVNGELVFDRGVLVNRANGKRILFHKTR